MDGKSVLAIAPPEEPNAPFRISASFRDEDGNERLRIEENTWKANVDNWDVEIVGGYYRFYNNKKELMIEIENKDRLLTFNHLDIRTDGHHFVFGKDGFRLETWAGEMYTFEGGNLRNCRGGVVIEGPVLAVGTDVRQGGGGVFNGIYINPGVRSQEQARAIFQKKASKYGIRALMDPSMGGLEPTSFTTAMGVIR